jgi:hypothetical protein
VLLGDVGRDQARPGELGQVSVLGPSPALKLTSVRFSPHGVYSASRMEAASEAERAGRAAGAAIGVGFILAIWAAGSLILGLLVYFTNPKASVRAPQPVRPSIERLKPIDEIQRAQVPKSPVSGVTHQHQTHR